MPGHRCFFGCPMTGHAVHSFPNPDKDPERFKVWVNIVGGKLESQQHYEFYKKKKICDIHFKQEHKNRYRRISSIAVPTLNLPDRSISPTSGNDNSMPSSTAAPLNAPLVTEAPIVLNPEAVNQSVVSSTAPCISGKMQPIIIVHGGAGDIPDSRVQGKLIGTKAAVKAGHEVLLKGGSALDAVEAAVVCMEKDENFNAGYGSVLNLDGEVEMEASIMCGKKLDVGAVTLIKEFLHPISIARRVLTDSPHSLLGGDGARRFALEKGFPTIDPESLITQNAKNALQKFLEHGEFGRTEIGIEDEAGVGTVGAVAVDSDGNIAVATSTGGMSGKAVGRIGDTPQIGSGTYADNNIGGVSTTGHGESILKYCLAHSIVRNMKSGVDASTATKKSVLGMTRRLNNTAGAITLSKDGDVGVYFSSKRMSWAYIRDKKIFYGIEHDIVYEEEWCIEEP